MSACLPVCICMWTMCIPGASEVYVGISSALNSNEPSPTMWVPGTKPKSSQRQQVLLTAKLSLVLFSTFKTGYTL